MSMLDVSVKKLYGVGAVRASAYAKMGITTVADLISHYPRGYENRGDVRLLSETDEQTKSSVVLVVATEPRVARIKGRMTLLKFKAYDDSGTCEITYFNQDYLKSSFALGSVFRFYGRVGRTRNGYSMSSPVYEPFDEKTPLAPLVPVYPLTEGISQKQIAKDMRAAWSLASCSAESSDFLPEDILKKHSLCTRSFALRQIHSPESFALLAKAKKRLIFDELFTFALGMSLVGSKPQRGSAPRCEDTDISALEAMLPYSLTNAQKRAIADIKRDMSDSVAMNRMIIGDVGCGKTVCAAAAIYIAVKNGLQAALMAPTEILAAQHFGDLSAMLEKLGVRCALLVGSMTASQKSKVHALCASGEIDVVVGTQALISEGVSFARAGLVVADEQHRFGVGQRALLAEKSSLSHMLVMSATPIPRTLALTMYGNLDVSRIDELPPGRQRVDTFVVDESYRPRLNAFIEKQILLGGQVYIVCPAVEVSEDEEADLLMSDLDGEGAIRVTAPLKSAVGYSAELSEIFPQYKVAFLHGKMRAKEKDSIMREFSEGNINILVSTTVIEVGVNVPSACLMIVENADRFGLSQLHQLRGRVGRGVKKSYCVLVSEAVASEGKTKQRLMTMKDCYDGFEIAERDLLMRGPGDFLKGNSDDTVRQSGGVRFRLAELCVDAELLNIAFDEAKVLLNKSPELLEYPDLAKEVTRMFTLEAGTIN
ncbi:MAG: ATP-dependent DNA helicase RecG [Clostridia bacterium]|nr:ATP-dependent DNA helicase RecG [Clostridia bacterium]